VKPSVVEIPLAFRVVRRVVEISHFDRKKIAKKPVLNVNNSNQLILRAINDGKPLLVSRFGTTETEFCLEYGAPGNNGNATILSIENLWRLSGVFPTIGRVREPGRGLCSRRMRTMGRCGAWRGS
jgi:hypothetical protein